MAASSLQAQSIDPEAGPEPSPPAPPRAERLPSNASVEDIYSQVFGGTPPQLSEAQYPLIIAGFNHGDLRVRPGRRGEPDLFERANLIEQLGPFLTDGKARELVALPAEEEWLSSGQLGAIEIEAVFDQQQLVVNVNVPLSFRAVMPIGLARRYNPSGLVDTETPRNFAASVNFFGGFTTVQRSALVPTGLESGDLTVAGAVHYRGYVFEGGGTYFTGFDGDDRFRRADLRLTRDLAARIIRVEAGDLSAPSRGLQGRPNMAGLSFFRYFSSQPYERFSSSPEQEFELARPARVSIFVNGRYVQEIRLSPGRYRLTDLPLQSAAGNDVQIELRYDSGEVEFINFPAFFDAQLLRAGVSEFALSGGILYRLEGTERSYEADRPAVSGFYRRGITQNLTAGIEFQADRDVALLGGEVLVASLVGTFGLLAASNLRADGIDGVALTALYRWNGSDYRRQATADIQARYTGPGYRNLQSPLEPPFEYGIRGRISFNLADTRRFQLTAEYQRERLNRTNEYAAEALVSQRLRFGSLAFSVRHEQSTRRDETSARISWTMSLGEGTASASYDTFRDNFRAAYNRPIRPGIDQLGYATGYNSFDGIDDLYLSGYYRGNRVEASAEQRLGRISADADFASEARFSAFASTALVTTGGRVALSRPVYDSFAIVAGREAVRQFQLGVDPQSGFGTSDRSYGARSGALGPAVIPDLSAFLVRTFEVEAINAPAGISVGGATYAVLPPYRSGYLIEVGDAGNAALIGSIVDQEGRPLAHAAGTAHLSDGDVVRTQPVFTNAAGRLYVDGVVPGSVVALHFEGEPVLRVNVRAPDDVIGVIRLQTPLVAVPQDEFDGTVQAPAFDADTLPDPAGTRP